MVGRIRTWALKEQGKSTVEGSFWNASLYEFLNNQSWCDWAQVVLLPITLLFINRMFPVLSSYQVWLIRNQPEQVLLLRADEWSTIGWKGEDSPRRRWWWFASTYFLLRILGVLSSRSNLCNDLFSISSGCRAPKVNRVSTSRIFRSTTIGGSIATCFSGWKATVFQVN